MKNNSSVRTLHLTLLPSSECQMFDLEHFMRHNTNLRELHLMTWGRQLLPDQKLVITNALEGKALKLLNLAFAHSGIGEDGYDMIISVCSKVERLAVICHNHQEVSALKSLLQDQGATLKSLEVSCNYCWNGILIELLPIVEGLKGNNTLISLEMSRSFLYDKQLSKVLCDSSSFKYPQHTQL